MESDWSQQALASQAAGCAAVLALGHEFLVQNPFMGGVLIDQIEPLRTFGDDVGCASLAYYAKERERLLIGMRGRVRPGGSLRG